MKKQIRSLLYSCIFMIGFFLLVGCQNVQKYEDKKFPNRDYNASEKVEIKIYDSGAFENEIHSDYKVAYVANAKEDLMNIFSQGHYQYDETILEKYDDKYFKENSLIIYIEAVGSSSLSDILFQYDVVQIENAKYINLFVYHPHIWNIKQDLKSYMYFISVEPNEQYQEVLFGDALL